MTDYSDDSTSQTRQNIEAQAAQWLMRLRCDSCSDAELAAHKDWLDANLMHRKAYLRLDALWDSLGEFAEKPEVIMARNQAKITSTAVVLPLPDKHVEQSPVPRESQPQAADGPAIGERYRDRKHAWIPVAAVASLIGIVLLTGFAVQLNWRFGDQETVYQTVTGEQKIVRLDDGSELLLDTETILRTDFSAQQRRIVLQQGRVRFEVAHDKARPFIVLAGSGHVTALGTAFVVRKEQQDVVVTLLEGKVAVTQQQTGGDSKPQAVVLQELEVGQKIAYSDAGMAATDVVDITRATAWQEGRLIYEDHPLASVIKDLNRYSKRKIVLEDKAMESIRITGVFKTGDNRKAVEALTKYFSMRIVTDDQGRLVLVSDDIKQAELDDH